MRPTSMSTSRMPLRLADGVTLYFARHGQTEANVEKRFSGYKDTPLTALGLEQAAQVGHILKRELGTAPGFAFVSSPLTRRCHHENRPPGDGPSRRRLCHRQPP